MGFGSDVRRIHVAIAVLAIAGQVPRLALASSSDAVSACIAAYERYERTVAAGDFIDARKSLGQCAASSCALAMQRECVSALAALEPRIPTVILVARDERKRDLTEVRVLVDGVVARTQLDGRELEINPGKHVVRFEMTGSPPVEQTVLVRERDKGRVLEAEITQRSAPAVPPPEPVARARAIPTLSWILGGVGVASFGTSAAFGAAALSARDEANDCRPHCSSRQVDIVNQRLLVADVGLGVGVVSLAVAVVLYLTQPPAERARATGAR